MGTYLLLLHQFLVRIGANSQQKSLYWTIPIEANTNRHLVFDVTDCMHTSGLVTQHTAQYSTWSRENPSLPDIASSAGCGQHHASSVHRQRTAAEVRKGKNPSRPWFVVLVVGALLGYTKIELLGYHFPNLQPLTPKNVDFLF